VLGMHRLAQQKRERAAAVILDQLSASVLSNAEPVGTGRHMGRRYLVDQGGGRGDSAAEGWPYIKLLRESAFTISPPGDMYEAYRTWEAVEAGSIPILIETPHTYNLCEQPSIHAFREMPFAIQLRSWDDLPSALATQQPT